MSFPLGDTDLYLGVGAAPPPRIFRHDTECARRPNVPDMQATVSGCPTTMIPMPRTDVSRKSMVISLFMPTATGIACATKPACQIATQTPGCHLQALIPRPFRGSPLDLGLCPLNLVRAANLRCQRHDTFSFRQPKFHRAAPIAIPLVPNVHH